MARRIRISTGDVAVEAALRDTETAGAIWEALPLTARVNTWGDEIYFNIPLSLQEEDNAQSVVAVGDLAFWPPGSAFCIFFGRTPASQGDEPTAASPVNVFGAVEGDAAALRSVTDGDEIQVTRVED